MKAESGKAGFGKLKIESLGVQPKAVRQTHSEKKLSEADAFELANFLALNGWDVTIAEVPKETVERRKKKLALWRAKNGERAS